MDKLAGTSVIYPIDAGIDFIDFAADLIQHTSSSDILKDVKVFSEREGKTARVSWCSKFTEIEDARIEMNMLACASGAIVKTKPDYKDLEI